MTRLTSFIRSRQKWLKTDFSALVAADVPSALQGLVPAARSGGEPGPQTSRTDPGDDDDEAGTERVKKVANVAKQPAAPASWRANKDHFHTRGGGGHFNAGEVPLPPQSSNPACMHACTYVLGCSQVVGAAGRPSLLSGGVHLEWLLVAVPSPGLIHRMYNAG